MSNIINHPRRCDLSNIFTTQPPTALDCRPNFAMAIFACKDETHPHVQTSTQRLPSRRRKYRQQPSKRTMSVRCREFHLRITKSGCLYLPLFYWLKHDGKIISPVWDIRLRPTFYPDHQIFIDKSPINSAVLTRLTTRQGGSIRRSPARAALVQSALLNIKFWTLSDKSQTAVIAA